MRQKQGDCDEEVTAVVQASDGGADSRTGDEC